MDAINTLQRLEGGQFMEKLAQELAEVSEVVRKRADETNKTQKGKLTVTFDIMRNPDTFDLAVQIHAGFRRSEPAAPTRGVALFVYEGELHIADPRSPELPAFRRVETEQPEERAVEDKTAERTANA